MAQRWGAVNARGISQSEVYDHDEHTEDCGDAYSVGIQSENAASKGSMIQSRTVFSSSYIIGEK